MSRTASGFALALLVFGCSSTSGDPAGSSSGGQSGNGSAGTSSSAGAGGSSALGGTAGVASGGTTTGSAGSAGASGGSSGSSGSSGSGGSAGAVITQWNQADLTHYTSYPDPGSEECIEYNGCTWAGYFAALPDQQTQEWVMANNIAAVHSKDFETYKLKTLRLRKDGDEIDVVVYDMCSDTDCSGCCTANSSQTGFLIDIEEYTYQRFGHGAGIVEWACLDCE